MNRMRKASEEMLLLETKADCCADICSTRLSNTISGWRESNFFGSPSVTIFYRTADSVRFYSAILSLWWNQRHFARQTILARQCYQKQLEQRESCVCWNNKGVGITNSKCFSVFSCLTDSSNTSFLKVPLTSKTRGVASHSDTGKLIREGGCHYT